MQSNQEEHIAETDLAILRALTEQVVKGRTPTCSDLLKRAQEAEKELLKGDEPETIRREHEALWADHGSLSR